MTSNRDIPQLLEELDRIDVRRSQINSCLEQHARITLLASARAAGLDVPRIPDWVLTRHLLALQEQSQRPGFSEWVERQPRLSPEMSARLERELRGGQAGAEPGEGDEDQSARPIALCLPTAPSEQDRDRLEQLGLKKKIRLGSRSPVEVWEGACRPRDLQQVLAAYGGRIIDLAPQEPSRPWKQSIRKNPASRRHMARHADGYRAVPDADLARPSQTSGGSEQSRDSDPQAEQDVDQRSSVDPNNGLSSGTGPRGTPPVHNAVSLRSPNPSQRTGALGPIRIPATGQPAQPGDNDPPADESSQQSNSTDRVTESQS